MENSKKEIYETNDNAPIEAEDFSVNENEQGENGEQENFEPSLP